MGLRNSEAKWGAVAKTFHWAGGALTIFMIGYGWWMIHLAQRSDRPANFAFHTEVGYNLLLLIVLRLAWRALDRGPSLPADTLRWERIAAHAGHAMLYVFLVSASVTGWLIISSARRAIEAPLLGFIPVPLLARTGDRAFHDLAEDIHLVLAYALLALIVVHVAAALRHHYVKKNDVLRRML